DLLACDPVAVLLHVERDATVHLGGGVGELTSVGHHQAYLHALLRHRRNAGELEQRETEKGENYFPHRLLPDCNFKSVALEWTRNRSWRQVGESWAHCFRLSSRSRQIWLAKVGKDGGHRLRPSFLQRVSRSGDRARGARQGAAGRCPQLL